MNKKLNILFFFSLLMSSFIISCKNKVEPNIAYEEILDKQGWVITAAVFPKSENMKDLLLDDLKEQLDNVNYNYRSVRDVYEFLEKAFPCILDNRYRFDKDTKSLIINTGDESCQMGDPFNNTKEFNETPNTNLGKGDKYYTISLMPDGSESSWEIDRTNKQLIIRKNPDAPGYSSSTYWEIVSFSSTEIILDTYLPYGYVYKYNDNSFSSISRTIKTRITLSPVNQ